MMNMMNDDLRGKHTSSHVDRVKRKLSLGKVLLWKHEACKWMVVEMDEDGEMLDDDISTK